MLKYLLFLMVLPLSGLAADYHLPDKTVKRNFDNARTIMLDIAKQHPMTFYSDCKLIKPKMTIQYRQCAYKPRKNSITSEIIIPDAEHVAAASWMFNSIECSVTGSDAREACLKESEDYQLYYTDLRNLYPAVPEINRDRKDMRWCDRQGGFEYGTTGFRIFFKEGGVEGCVNPPDRIKGDIARTMQYMIQTYGIESSTKEDQMYKRWSVLDPVDDWERKRESMIKKIQQDKGNPFIR